MGSVLVKYADRMMTSANTLQEGIEIFFADGCKGFVPFEKIAEVKEFRNLDSIELPNPYVVILHTKLGETVELPWDFARYYCDESYQPRVDVIALSGRQAIGVRIRQLRESAGLTQAALAHAANIGRVTLVRIENGEQSPRYKTVVSLARALERPNQELLVGTEASA